jgi:Zn-dependent M28 family amino/carboxypeptidase
MRSHLEPRADRVVLHEFNEISPLDSTEMALTNVIAVFGAEHTKRLAFGAHWDTRPVADQEDVDSLRTRPVPGANDGASGVAVLLEVAEALSARKPKVGVDLLFFDGEDSGRDEFPRTFALGSQRFVRDHPTYRPRIAVVLDMVGRRDARIPREGNSVLYSGWAVESVWGAARDLGLTVLVDSVGVATFDDHIAFIEAGIPAVDILDLRDPAWHTVRDLPENCSAETLDQIGRLVLELIARAEAE